MTLDELVIQINAESKNAVTALDELNEKLKTLMQTLGLFSSAGQQITGALNKISEAVQKAGSSNQQAKNEFEKLKDTIEKQEKELEKLKNQYSSYVLNNEKSSESAKALRKEIDSLASELNDNKTRLEAAQKAADGLTNGYENLKSSSSNAGKSTQSLSDKLARTISKWRTLFGAVKNLADKFYGWYEESNNYIETLNLFNVTMGDAAQGAREYAEAVQEAMGIDSKDFMQYQGVFKNLAAGFGVAEDAANTMSQNLTQLSYDMASFFNTESVDGAFDKLSSAMSGQVKGLREFGINTTVAALQEYALSNGIDKSVRSMTQAEQSLLRYNYIMEQSRDLGIWNDMARTIVTPANALRVFNAQLTQMKRALGNIVSVLVTRFIPYMQAAVELITDAGNSIANFFGYELPDIDYSGFDTDGFAEDFEDAAKSAAEIKKQLMGFDELNIISNQNSSDVDGSSGGAIAGMKPIEYDFLAGLKTEKLDEIKEKVTEIAKQVGIAAAGFAGWKISSSLLGVGTAAGGLTSLLGTGDKEGVKAAAKALALKFKKAFGIALMAAGATTDIQVAVDSWSDGVSWDGLVDQLKGAGLLHLGGFLFGGTSGMGAGAMIDGVISALPAAKSAIADGNKEWSNTLSLVKGISTAFGGLSVITGNWIPVAIGGVIAIGSTIAIYWQEIIDWFKRLPKTIGNFFSKLWKNIKNIFGAAADWFNDKVIQPIVGFFSGLWTSVSGFFIGLWNDICNVWIGAATWFNDTVIQPIVNFFSPIVEWISTFFYGCWLIIKAVWITVSDWFNEKVVQPVVGFFKQLWEDIKAVWETVSNWFNETVIIPVVDLFKWLCEVVSGFFTQLWEDIKNSWKFVTDWYNTYVIQPLKDAWNVACEAIGGFFSSLWEGIKSSWKIVSDWYSTYVIQPLKDAWREACEAIGGFFNNLWSGIKWGVVEAMNGMIWVIESALNWVLGGINKLIDGFNGVVEWAANVVGADWGGLSTIKTVSLQRIDHFANGGFPAMGEMFIAREAGPELVGQIGNKTAVANNDQIVSGIEAGVYRAMMAANAGHGGGSQTIRIINEIDGDVVGEKVIQYHNNRVIQTGVSPLLA